jgi:ectoine hydroxylase-related dioxygenase (phytanoyl-CoA dioxygenase family)
MDPAVCERHVAAIARDGFTIVEHAIEPDLVATLAAALERLERELAAKPGGNAFEGARTVRIYNLLAHGPPFTAVPVHARVLPIVEGVIGEGCLISSLSSIGIDPGESAQPIHADDQVIPLDKPHRSIICNSMWALTDFTEENGATRLVPASHGRPSPEYGGAYETIGAEMARGSVLIWDGALWHGGGANTSGARRTGLAMNYCAGFIRQQENQQLGLSPDLVRGFEPRLRQLVGYGVYRGLIGHIDKHSPDQLLTGAGTFRSIWDQGERS